MLNEVEREAWRRCGGHTPMCGCDSDRGVEDKRCRYTQARREVRAEFKALGKPVTPGKSEKP